jgi:Asp/Glu/hydantoin racemase
MIVQGGPPVAGLDVGILMLDTRFPRIRGDVGNARTWNFAVQYQVVANASPDRVVRQGAAGLLDDFIKAAQAMERQGVAGIAANCGFLTLFQAELADAVSVPVVTSSLLQIPQVNRLLGRGRRAGVLTISGKSLKPDHLRAAGAPLDTPVGTTEGGREFTRAILGDELQINVDLARQDNVEAALALVKAHPELGAIVLECTNMCPFAADIQAATGLPVYSMVTLVNWFQAGLRPPRFRD